jgi:hypothetical protein
MSDTQRYARVDRHHQKASPQAGLGGLSSDVTRQRLIPVIYYSESAFQGYGFENSRFTQPTGGMRKIKGLDGSVGHVLSLSTSKRKPPRP